MAQTKAPLSAQDREPLGARAELPFALTLTRGPEALSAQLVRQLRAAVLEGQLAPGAPLPASRALARSLGVARGAVVEAYAELHAEGYLEARHGSGTRVARELGGIGTGRTSPDAPAWLPGAAPAVYDAPVAPGLIDFRLGQPSLAELDARAWRRAWAAVGAAPPPDDYGDPAGESGLRAALAAFITRSRGLPARPEELLVTGGAVQGLDLIARSVLRPGDPAAIEDPGYRLARQVLEERGARVLPVPVDDDGLRVDQLPTGPGAPRLVYCTPSHQYPLGVRLSVARRLALIAWARDHDALIVEDDYDSEFRFGAPPLPTLAGLDDGGRVLYLGTLSKVLTPALRLGYLLAPPALHAHLTRQKLLSDYGSPWPTQRAAEELLRGGHLDRHVRRMRRLYAHKRARLAELLAPLAPHATLRGIEAGLHVCLELAPPLNAEQVAAACLARGVRVSTLNSYQHASSRQALLLGYGALTLPQIERGAAVLRAVIGEAGR